MCHNLPDTATPQSSTRRLPPLPLLLILICWFIAAAAGVDRRAMQQAAADESDMPAADRELLKWQLSQDTALDTADAQLDHAACGEPASAPVASTSTPSQRTPSWQLPLPLSAICVVDTVEKLAVARSHLLGDAENAAASGKVTVIGIDCEWQPQERGKEKYPVALMQVSQQAKCKLSDSVALRCCNCACPGQRLARTPISPPAAMPAAQLAVKDHVFLLDLQTLCNKGSTAALPPAHSARQRHQQQRRSQAIVSSAVLDQAEPLTHEQITTGRFIQDLFSAGGGS